MERKSLKQMIMAESVGDDLVQSTSLSLYPIHSLSFKSLPSSSSSLLSPLLPIFFSLLSSMADDDAPLKPQHQSPTNLNFPSHFLFRALIAFLFFIIIPILPSIFPESLAQNLLSQSWELLHIVFVGIAVSYGLFSRRYSDSAAADSPPKSDSSSSHSYISRLLQASSVFDDDADSPTCSSSPSTSFDDDGGSKVQTWSSQYFRNEPVVVLANKKQADDDDNDRHKPLLLPVRSLKSRVSDDNGGDSRVSGLSYSSSSSYSSNWDKVRNVSLKSRASSGSDTNSSSDGAPTTETEGAVLPSPIPWRSRSGRMERKEENQNHLPPPPIEEKDDLSPSNWTQLSSKPPSMKRSEDSTRRKAVYRSPPPPPPPPPPPLYNRSQLLKSKARIDDHVNEPSSWEMGRSKVDYSSSRKSCRTVRSRSWEEASEEEEQSVAQEPDELTHDWDDGGDDFPVEVPATSEDDDDDDDEEDEVRGSVERTENGGGACSSSGVVDDDGPDVDKKADEFIAKFREQIRLQRIESIKRSTVQFSRNSVG